jgi:hypothetical protein
MIHIETHIGLYAKCLLLLLSFNQNLNVFTDCSKSPQYQFTEILISGYEVVTCIQTYTDGRTDWSYEASHLFQLFIPNTLKRYNIIHDHGVLGHYDHMELKLWIVTFPDQHLRFLSPNLCECKVHFLPQIAYEKTKGSGLSSSKHYPSSVSS